MRNRSKFEAMVAVLILIIAHSSFAFADTFTMYVLCSPSGEVNIRDRASSEGNREGWLILGDAVTVEKTAEDTAL